MAVLVPYGDATHIEIDSDIWIKVYEVGSEPEYKHIKLMLTDHEAVLLAEALQNTVAARRVGDALQSQG